MGANDGALIPRRDAMRSRRWLLGWALATAGCHYNLSDLVVSEQRDASVGEDASSGGAPSTMADGTGGGVPGASRDASASGSSGGGRGNHGAPVDASSDGRRSGDASDAAGFEAATRAGVPGAAADAGNDARPPLLETAFAFSDVQPR